VQGHRYVSYKYGLISRNEGGGVISEKPRGNHVAAAAADDRIESRRHSALIFTVYLCHHFSYSWLKSASFILEIVVELNSLTTYKPHH